MKKLLLAALFAAASLPVHAASHAVSPAHAHITFAEYSVVVFTPSDGSDLSNQKQLIQAKITSNTVSAGKVDVGTDIPYIKSESLLGNKLIEQDAFAHDGVSLSLKPVAVLPKQNAVLTEIKVTFQTLNSISSYKTNRLTVDEPDTSSGSLNETLPLVKGKSVELHSGQNRIVITLDGMMN